MGGLKMDIVGKRFGKLIVKNADDHRKGYVVCECDCGNITSVRATSPYQEVSADSLLRMLSESRSKRDRYDRPFRKKR